MATVFSHMAQPCGDSGLPRLSSPYFICRRLQGPRLQSLDDSSCPFTHTSCFVCLFSLFKHGFTFLHDLAQSCCLELVKNINIGGEEVDGGVCEREARRDSLEK